MFGAGPLHGADRLANAVAGRSVGVFRLVIGPLGQDASAVRRAVEERDAAFGRIVHERPGAAVDQREPIVIKHHLELPGGQELAHQRNRAARHSHVGQYSLVAQVSQGPHRAARSHRLGEREVVLGIVKVHQLDPIQAKAVQALGDRPLDPLPGEVASVRVGVHLGGQDKSGRQSAGGRQHMPDTPLGRAAAVVVRGVHEVKRTAQYLTDRRFGAVCGYLIAV